MQAIRIAIERDAVVGPLFAHRVHQGGRRCRAEAGVDVETIGLAADGDDLGAEFVEHVGRDLVGGAVRGIDDDLQAFQRQVVGEGALAELDVATLRIVEPARLAEPGRIDPLRRLGEDVFDVVLPGVGQFLAAR